MSSKDDENLINQRMAKLLERQKKLDEDGKKVEEKKSQKLQPGTPKSSNSADAHDEKKEKNLPSLGKCTSFMYPLSNFPAIRST